MKLQIFTAEDIYRMSLIDKLFTLNQLASWLDLKPQTLSKRLIHGKDFTTEFQTELNKIFKREGFITDKIEQCNLLIKQTLQTETIMNSSLAMLGELVMEYTGDDNELSYDEKKNLIEQLEQLRESNTDAIHNLIKIVKGKK
jgi:hypothetical protein